MESLIPNKKKNVNFMLMFTVTFVICNVNLSKSPLLHRQVHDFTDKYTCCFTNTHTQLHRWSWLPVSLEKSRAALIGFLTVSCTGSSQVWVRLTGLTAPYWLQDDRSQDDRCLVQSATEWGEVIKQQTQHVVFNKESWAMNVLYGCNWAAEDGTCSHVK